MINTFKPFCRIFRGCGSHGWFWFRFEICSTTSIGLSLLGYGFLIGFELYSHGKELLKEKENENE